VHALLIPIGSHGDVHPFVGLGLALKARGHRVTLVTNEHFADLARRADLEFRALGTDDEFRKATDDPRLWEPRKGFRLVMSMVAQLIRPLYEIIAAEYVPGETVLAAQVTAWGARIAHEALGVPLVTVHLQPAVFLSAIDPPKVPLYHAVRPLPLWARRMLLRMAERTLADPLLAPPINTFRSELGLRPTRRIARWWHSPQRILGLFPDWFAPPQADWPPNVTLAGFPLFDESAHAAIDPEVTRFLDAGPPPIVFTAGSAMRHGAEFFREAVATCRLLDRRGLLLARFAEQVPRDLPDGVRHLTYVPFSQVLPRAAAVVHHGGIGTTAQGLAAGIPQLVMPLAHDQPDNAQRLERLGVGRTLGPDRFRAPAAASALRALLDDPRVASRAVALARRIDPAAALDRACAVLEEATRPGAAVAV
jgi:rhamnosyltransferase subunit B